MLLWLKTKLASNYATSDLIFIMKQALIHKREASAAGLGCRNLSEDVFTLTLRPDGRGAAGR